MDSYTLVIWSPFATNNRAQAEKPPGLKVPHCIEPRFERYFFNTRRANKFTCNDEDFFEATKEGKLLVNYWHRFALPYLVVEGGCDRWFIQVEKSQNGTHMHVVLSGPSLEPQRMSRIKAKMQNAWVDFFEWHLGHLAKGVKLWLQTLRDFGIQHLKKQQPNGRLVWQAVNMYHFINNYLLQKPHWGEVGPEGNSYIYAEASGDRTLENLLPEHSPSNLLEPKSDGPNLSLPYSSLNPAGVSEPSALKGTALAMNIIQQYCVENFVFDESDLMHQKPNEYLKVAALGQQKIDIVLRMARNAAIRATPLDVLFKRHKPMPEHEINPIKLLLMHQGVDPLTFSTQVIDLLTKTSGKKNTMVLEGPPSTGKTMLIQPLMQGIGLWGSLNTNNENFPFNDCQDKLALWFEELEIKVEFVESFKMLSCGQDCRIDKKCKDSVRVQRTPIFVTTNNNPYMVKDGNAWTTKYKAALEPRMTVHTFLSKQRWLPITADDWSNFLQWGIDERKNLKDHNCGATIKRSAMYSACVAQQYDDGPQVMWRMCPTCCQGSYISPTESNQEGSESQVPPSDEQAGPSGLAPPERLLLQKGPNGWECRKRPARDGIHHAKILLSDSDTDTDESVLFLPQSAQISDPDSDSDIGEPEGQTGEHRRAKRPRHCNTDGVRKQLFLDEGKYHTYTNTENTQNYHTLISDVLPGRRSGGSD